MLIVAPAGSGKTTLLAQYVGRSGIPAAWYRAEAPDTSESALLAHLGAAVAAATDQVAGADFAWSSVEEASNTLDGLVVGGPADSTRLVIIVDRSASMGSRGSEPGPLAAAKAELGKGELAYRRVAVVAVAAHVEPLADGTAGQARDALGRIEASELPGGLDRAAEGADAEAITAVVGQGADVVLVSDFQQDDGARLEALLKPRCRSVTRLAVGRPAANAAIAAIERVSDLRPGQPGELLLRISGPARGVAVAGDDGAWLPAGQVAAEAGGLLRVALPPLTPGDHLLRVRIDDDGLAYDNLLELPVLARPAVLALAVGERTDFLAAALKADGEAFSFRLVNHRDLRSRCHGDASPLDSPTSCTL